MDLATRTHRRLLATVAAIVLATVVGLVALWPRADRLPQTPDVPAELITGEIRSVERFETEPDPIVGTSGAMVRVEVRLTSGPDTGTTTVIEAPVEGYPTFEVGDEVELTASEGPDGGSEYFIVDFARSSALWWLLGLFVVAVLGVGRLHGLRSLLGLGISLLIVTRFIVPAILAGSSPFLVALVGSVAVMLVTLYLAHGVNEMTTAAVVGTAVALTVTIGLGAAFIDQAKLTGFTSEEANLARFTVEGLDLQGLVLAGLIIAALGVLDDVTVAQASTVFALHDTDPSLGWRPLVTRAMGVGRDHIASTVNTLFLAYAGASIALLLLFATGGAPVGEIVTSEVFAEEIVKTLVGSIGLIAAVPFTTALAATLAIRRPAGALQRQGPHHVPAATVPAGRPVDEPDDDELDDDERAYRSWVRYLREGPQGEGRPDGGHPQHRDRR